MHRDFWQMIRAKWAEKKFFSIGLDTDRERIPDTFKQLGARLGLIGFNRAIIDATKTHVCAYKLNSAFYEAHGDQGWAALRETIVYINEQAPDVPVIYDGKRADIGNTNEGYIQSAFSNLRADAITIQPYAGRVAVQPFLDKKDKGIIVWCRSSNDGAGEFQDLLVGGPSRGPGVNEPLYLRVARNVAEDWNENGNCALVVGATYPEEMKRVREVAGDIPLLIPGIGAQGGDIARTVAAGRDSRGTGFIIAVARSIIFASSGKDFAEAARRESEKIHGAIVEAL